MDIMDRRSVSTVILGVLAWATAMTVCATEQASVVQQGRLLYTNFGCYACHGYEGQGAAITGPRIAPDPLPMAAFTEVIRRPPNVMPAYSPDVLSDEDLQRIHTFLQSIPRPPAAEDLPGLSRE